VQSSSFAEHLGRGVVIIGKDELTFIKAPFRKKNLKWDALFVGVLVPLIATDEQVVQQVNPGWHDTGIAVSNAILGINVVTAGGIFVSGLVTEDAHAKETGVATARGVVDSVIMYGAMKAIFQRERPFSGGAEGKFFSGNWSNGSFPSGHSMFNWTIASVIAHEYPKWPVALAMYSLATASSTYRVTAGVHFPSDVVAGGVMGYLIGRYVAKQDNHLPGGSHPKNKMARVEDAILSHVSIGVQ
jgi:membrane-associated phospholipid phosphatase